MAGASDAREKTQEEDREETVGADAGENPNEGNDLLAEAKEQDGAAEAGAGKEAAHALALNLRNPAPWYGRSGETCCWITAWIRQSIFPLWISTNVIPHCNTVGCERSGSCSCQCQGNGSGSQR